MKKTLLALLAACTLHTVATAQSTGGSTNGNTGGNTGGHMNNRNAGVDDGSMPPAGRENRDAGRDRMRNDGSTTAMERGDASAMIGNMSRADFDRRNQEGNAAVAAIRPTSTPLSKSDQKLLVQMALGGMTQLRASQAALGRLQRDDVRVLAQSEVEEQTSVSAKIQEIARAKGMTLANDSGAATTQMLDRMQGMSGADLDRHYTRASGVNGHEKLMKTGEKIMAKAQDPALKALAAATAPVIRMHMEVSQQVLSKMGNGNAGGAARGGRAR